MFIMIFVNILNNFAVVGSGFAGLIDNLLLSENSESNAKFYE